MENPIYFASFNMLELRPKEMVKKIKNHNFDGVEILADGNHQLKGKNIEIFKELSQELPMSIHAPFEGINLASLNDEIWENSIKKTIATIKGASEINARCITIHPGHLTSVTTHFRDRAWRRTIRAFRRLADYAEEQNTTIAIENMPKMEHLFCKHPSEIEGFIETVGRPNLKFTFDIGHAHTNDNIDEFLENIDQIHHIHIHDNKGDYDSHLELGDGTINIRQSLKKLRDYEGIYVIEGRTLSEGERSKQKMLNYTEKTQKTR
ncbi:sugar phosphate isomerase/epimerase family protein [Methanonatronarchaeum sp. AMET-Sl]|uniref:sugar phosphate isomerase/epimerase family protein n=1 Tax=Methanonatronarchaeum sp. AMET-Sl TaxID=3037654 RepID=UPI00244DDE71|nr:sugar phosphate isomerase/epimerase family protein [Methanonatronarchaeum sp. AMET-Sl]WGI17810.1 sugar phosphate isomerase/epimerase [Methanonatronarchaeum sp. AMET-Sl]